MLTHNKQALNKKDLQLILDLIKPQIEKQAFNPFLSYIMANMGLMWSPQYLYMYNKNLSIEHKVNINSINDVQHINHLAQYNYYFKDQNELDLPKIPEELLKLVGDRCGLDMTDYDALLINIYPPNRTLNCHIDHSEDITAIDYPIVSVLLGETCVFTYSLDKYDKNKYTPDMRLLNKVDINIGEGDILVFGQEHRLMQHRVVVPDNINMSGWPTLKLNKDCKPQRLKKYRINLTFRRAAPINNDGPKKISIIESEKIKERKYKKLF